VSTRRTATPRAARVPAAIDPVARLMVDVPLAHLDRPFDYLVPEALAADVGPGSRVRVRFSGRLVDAYVLERRAASEHEGKLAFLERAVGGEPVLTVQTTALFRAVADRWAGNFVDVLRLGVPSRHAAAETATREPAPRPTPPQHTGFDGYRAGPAFLSAVANGRAARAVWSARPGEPWPDRLADAIHVALAAGRGAIAVVPDARDLARLDAALSAALGSGCYVALSADLGPAERYRRWLAVRRGDVRAVIGVRAAAYAPVADLGLLAIWDDGDDLYDEPRAPYAHARDVLVLRSSLTGAALLVGGYARTAEAQLLVESGWAHEIAADRPVVRAAAPRVVATGDDAELARDPAAAAARLPSLAWRSTHDALAAGHSVLVQVPRRGYVPALACVRDRTPARCPVCSGPLAAASEQAIASCRWCGRPAGGWTCPACGGRRMRAVVVGAGRTAEELGRAFPGFAVRTSGGERVLASVGPQPALVVATPGAEPVAEDGYGAALLLDGWALLSRADLRAAEETLRRWLNAAALVRAGGPVVVGADAGIAAVQALVRWDPGGFAARELAERIELGFPPASRMASLTGPRAAVDELLAAATLPPGAEVIGPVPAGHGAGDSAERKLIRVPRALGADLAAALKVAAAARSARKAADPIKLVLDPRELF
jgi:primosomal protein N' (replication factor Y) (superfamily II helicase)